LFRCDISKYQDYPQKTIKLIILRSRDENELLVCPAYSSKTSSATPDAAPSARIKILSAF